MRLFTVPSGSLKRGGHFDVGLAAVVREFDRCALFGGQSVHRRAQAIAFDHVDDFQLVVFLRLRGEALGQTRPPALRAQARDRFVANADDEKAAQHAPRARIGVRGTPNAGERIVHAVLRVVGVAEHVVGGGVEQSAVALVRLVERPALARGKCRREPVVILGIRAAHRFERSTNRPGEAWAYGGVRDHLERTLRTPPADEKTRARFRRALVLR